MNIKRKKNFIIIIYLSLITATVIATTISIQTNKDYYVQNRALIKENDLGSLLIEYSISSRSSAVNITQKHEFYIVNISVQSKLNEATVKSDYDKVVEDLLYISENYYTKKKIEADKLYKAILSEGNKVEIKSFDSIKRLIDIELFMENPMQDFKKFSDRLINNSEFFVIENQFKNFPIAIFFFVVLIIFHLFKNKIVKILI